MFSDKSFVLFHREDNDNRPAVLLDQNGCCPSIINKLAKVMLGVAR